MSTVKVNRLQIGQSSTATQNFSLEQPVTPDGTVKLVRGNAGAGSQDILTVDASGDVLVGGNNLNLFSAKSLAASGYQKLPSGLIIQWGNFAASASADTAATFPIAFPTACQAVTATHGLYAGVDAGSSVIVSKSTTGFSYAAYLDNSTRNGATNVFYFAIGY